MMLGIQFLGILFGLFMLYYSFLNFKRKEITNLEFSGWVIMWGVFIFLSVYPDSLDFFTKSVNAIRTMDLLTVLGFFFLIGLTYHNYFVARKNQRRIETLVRAIALKKK